MTVLSATNPPYTATMSKLTDTACRSATYTGGVLKLRDGNGLYLHVLPSGKYWRYDYRYPASSAGKRRTLSLGVFPAVSLKQARIDLHAAKATLAEGIDPSYQKRLRRNVSGDDSFQAVAGEWLRVQDWADNHRHTVVLRLEKDLYPVLGHRPVQDLTAPDFLHVLRIIESRGAVETAHRVKTVSSQIMRYAVACGLITSDPCRDLRGVLKTPRAKRYAAITDPKKFGAMLRAIDLYDNDILIAHALRLAPYVALRPGELRGARRDEFDFDTMTWNIPPERMKKNRAHQVPLSASAAAILKSAWPYSQGKELLFPSRRSAGRPISEGTLNAALKYLGYPGDVHTPHGFRSSFSTMAYESGLFDESIIEMQLAHLDKNRVKSAYNRAEHADERRRLMDWWGGQVDAMRVLI